MLGTDASSIEMVSSFQMRQYLLWAGWKEKEKIDKRRVLFSKQDSRGHQLDIIVPLLDGRGDSVSRKLDVIYVVAQMLEQSVSETAAQMVNYNCDFFRFRVIPQDNSDKLPIEDAQRYVKGLKNLYLYSNCSEINQKAFFQYPLPSAKNHLNEHKFGHTFRGSFGFSVYSDVLVENQSSDFIESAPLSRRVTARIAKGIYLTKVAADKNDPDLLVSRYKEALNSKMCDALYEMTKQGTESFTFLPAWARAVKASEELIDISEIKIGAIEADVLEYASEKLKSVNPTPIEIRGYVTNLHCQKNPEDESSRRTIAVKTDHEEYGTIEVRMDLGNARYQKAIEAHGRGLNVCVSGELERKGNHWLMSELRKFRLDN